MSTTAMQLKQTFQIVKDEMSNHAIKALEKALESKEGFILLPQSGMAETTKKELTKGDILTVILSPGDWQKLTGCQENVPPFPIPEGTNFAQMLIVYPDEQ